jgi:hypothetical protein
LNAGLLTRYHDFLRAPGVRQAIIDRANQTVNTDPVARLKRISAPTAKDDKFHTAQANDTVGLGQTASAFRSWPKRLLLS